MVNAAVAASLNDETQLAAVGVGNVCSFIVIVSVMMGLNSGQDTLTSQAYGNGNLKLCGVYLNRGAFILTLVFIPLAIIPSTRAEQILILMGQDKEVSHLAQGYIWYFMPGLYCLSMFDLLQRFLGAMCITTVPMVSQLIASLLHAPLCLIFTFKADMGIYGLGLATSITNFNLLLLTVI